MSEEQDFMKRLRHISAVFLEGTTATTPEEAVNTGQRTLQEWCDALRPKRQASPLEYSKPIDKRRVGSNGKRQDRHPP